jgi:hypothetical protein
VTGPAPAGGGGGVGGVLVDGASPEAPLEGDGVEDGEAAPEAELESETVPPEAALEGGEEAPKLELEGVTRQGPGIAAGASTWRGGGSPTGGGDIATCSYANGK